MQANRCTPLLENERLATLDASAWIYRIERLLWSIDGVGPRLDRKEGAVIASPGAVHRDLASRVVDAAMSGWHDVESLSCRCGYIGSGAVEGELLLELVGGGRLLACFYASETEPPALREVWVDD